MYYSINFAGIDVSYLPELDGGGRTFGQQFLTAVSEVVGPVKTVFEFCCGPGFIGFSLLGHALCERLYLADINQDAIDAVNFTIRKNCLNSKATAFKSDGIANLVPMTPWDLVVANPPHFSRPPRKDGRIITTDHDWGLHARFFSNVKSRLAPGGSVLLQENYEGSSAEEFVEMAQSADLTHLATFSLLPHKDTGERFYFVWFKNISSRIICNKPVNFVNCDLSDFTTLQLKENVLYRLRISNCPKVRLILHDNLSKEIFWNSFIVEWDDSNGLSHSFILGKGEYSIVAARSDSVAKPLAKLFVA